MSFEQDPFEAPPRASHPHHAHKKAGERLHGGASHARHHGVTHHPHSHELGSGQGLHHPHHAALAGTHTQQSHQQTAGRGRTRTGRHRSRVHLAARAGLQRIEVGTIASFNAAAGTAMVRLLGTQADLIGPLPLSEGIAPALAVAGANCLVVLLDEENPADAAVIAVYNAPPALWTQAGSVAVVMSGYQLAQSVVFPASFGTAIAAVAACSRDPNFTVSVSGETLGGFVLTVTRREGATQLQAGAANVTVASGAGSGAATVTFPTPFAVGRTAVATSSGASWAASVAAPSATGVALTVTGLGGAVGPATITVYWQVTGDPAVSATVNVDWLGVGT